MRKEEDYVKMLAGCGNPLGILPGMCRVLLENVEYKRLIAERLGLHQPAPAPCLPVSVNQSHPSKPTISPPAGEYVGLVRVSLVGQEGFALHYTINGDDPSPGNSLVYQPDYPIKLSEARRYTIRAISVNHRLDLCSECVQCVYEIKEDTRALSVPTISPEGGTYTHPIYVELSHGDNLRIQYKKDVPSQPPSASWQTYTISLLLQSNGEYTISARSTDGRQRFSEEVRMTYVISTTASAPVPPSQGEAIPFNAVGASTRPESKYARVGPLLCRSSSVTSPDIPKPTFEPPSGTYPNGVMVNIDSKGDFDTRYTDNDKFPPHCWMKFKPILLTGTQTLKAFNTKKGRKRRLLVESFAVSLGDRTPPILRLSEISVAEYVMKES